MLVKGIVERVGLSGSFIHQNIGFKEIKRSFKCENHQVAIQNVLELLVSPIDGVLKHISEVDAIGHRVVHGGEEFVKSTIINTNVEQVIKELSSLAPLHNPPNLQGIHAAKVVLPNIPHVAVFDTAFHQSIPEHVYRYAIPSKWYIERKIRRYGFHGTSHYYVSQRAMKLLGSSTEDSRIISLHLGNGASIAAVKDGISVDTSMGLTPLEGLVMGTRSGDIDPGIVLYMMQTANLSSEEVDEILNRQSGLLGIAHSSDMRDIEQKVTQGDAEALLALKLAVYRVRKYIGAYFVSLGGLDAIVFTAGIGERSSHFRSLVLRDLEFLGIELDQEANLEAVCGSRERTISSDTSKIKVFVIPTNEELVMAQDTEKIVNQTNSKNIKAQH